MSPDGSGNMSAFEPGPSCEQVGGRPSARGSLQPPALAQYHGHMDVSLALTAILPTTLRHKWANDSNTGDM